MEQILNTVVAVGAGLLWVLLLAPFVLLALALMKWINRGIKTPSAHSAGSRGRRPASWRNCPACGEPLPKKRAEWDRHLLEHVRTVSPSETGLRAGAASRGYTWTCDHLCEPAAKYWSCDSDAVTAMYDHLFKKHSILVLH